MLNWFKTPSPRNSKKSTSRVSESSAGASRPLSKPRPGSDYLPRTRLSYDDAAVPSNTGHVPVLIPTSLTVVRDTRQSGSSAGEGQTDRETDAAEPALGVPGEEQAKKLPGSTCQLPFPYSTLTLRRDEHGKKLVNQYLKERVLGRGSYAKVVLYKDTNSGQLVAIKTASKSRLRRQRVFGLETALCALRREAQILHLNRHPNIVKLVEVMDDDSEDKLYTVLEYASQGALFSGTGPQGGIGEERARRCMRGVVDALLHLHANGVVHGDVKPDNILVTGDNSAKLADFSVSTILEPGQEEIRRSPGTLIFSAPECCTGTPFNGAMADIWALGCTLYLCVCGKYPFFGATMEATFNEIMHASLHVPDSLSKQLQDLLLKILEKDPLQRISLQGIREHQWMSE